MIVAVHVGALTVETLGLGYGQVKVIGAERACARIGAQSAAQLIQRMPYLVSHLTPSWSAAYASPGPLPGFAGP